MFTAARTLAAAGVGLSALVFAGTAAGAPPTAPNPGVQTLLNNLSGGYSPADCQPTTPNGTAVADINCGANHDPGGPTEADYTLFANATDMNNYFNGALRAGKTLPFPDGTPGPGTWQQHATPNQVAGSDAISVSPHGNTILLWTNNATQILGIAGSNGSNDVPLYNWWLKEG